MVSGMYVCPVSANLSHFTQCQEFAQNINYTPWRPTQGIGIGNMDCTETEGVHDG